MRALLALSLAFAPAPLLAQDAVQPAAQATVGPLTGSWALQIDGATIFRFDIARVGTGWQSSWLRPKSFASGGDSFEKLSTEGATVESSTGVDAGEWAELTFPDNRPGAVPDVFRLRVLGPDRAQMVYVDTGLAPFTLVRVASDAPLGPFVDGKTYRRMSVAALGLPDDKPAADPNDKPLAFPVPRVLKPIDPAIDLPPRQTDKAPTSGR